MSDDHRGRFTQGRHQANHVSDGLAHVVGFDGVWPIGLPKSPLIGHDDPKAGLGQSHDLAPPHVPKVRKTVQQDDERALPLVDVVQADAVDFGEAVVERAGVVGVQLPRRGARLTVCFSALASIVLSILRSSRPPRIGLTACAMLSFAGHDLVKLGQVRRMPTLTRSASLTDYEHVARSVGLDPFRMLRMAKLPATVLDDPNMTISADSVGWLLEESARLSGQEAFGCCSRKREAWPTWACWRW